MMRYRNKNLYREDYSNELNKFIKRYKSIKTTIYNEYYNLEEEDDIEDYNEFIKESLDSFYDRMKTDENYKRVFYSFNKALVGESLSDDLDIVAFEETYNSMY